MYWSEAERGVYARMRESCDQRVRKARVRKARVRKARVRKNIEKATVPFVYTAT